MNSSHGAPEGELEVRLIGDISPETVAVTDLLGILDAVTKVIAAAGGNAEDLRLVEVREGSAGYAFSTTQNAGEVVAGVIAQWVQDPESVSEELRSPLDRLRERIPQDSKLQIKQTIGDAVYEAVLPRLDSAPAKPLRIRGWTVVHGVLEDLLTSKAPTARVRVPGRDRLLFVNVSRDQVRQLGPMITGPVKLEGEAAWDSETWEMLGMDAKVIHRYIPSPLEEGLKGLADAAGSTWDDLDVEELIDSLRGE